jgi:glycosyltransferase involved in cell wall biosynthesis
MSATTKELHPPGNMIRIALETSITRLVGTGLGVYATNLAHALRQSAISLEIVQCEIPAFMHKAPNLLIHKLFAAYWQIMHARVVIPLKVKQSRCDLIHYTMTMPVPAAMPCPVVATIHDIIPLKHPEWVPPVRGYRLRQGLRLAAKRAQHIIADSEATRRDVIAYFGVPAPQVTAVPLGADLQLPALSEVQAQQIVRTHYQLGPGYVLCVSSLEPRKNIERVVEAFGMLCRRKPAMPPLVVVGGGDRRKNRLQTFITANQLQSRVFFTDHVPAAHLAALFRCAGVFVYPSLYEGFGMPPLEAMILGCPVITSNTSSLPEVVGDAALLVDPYDSSALAAAIDQVLTDRLLASTLRRRGQDRAQEFTWRRCAQETVAVYHRVLTLGQGATG